jgi:uncharacterized membrane protein YqgA involved in biofilm formation
MFATIVNCIAVILGAAIGLLGAKMIKEGYREVVFNGSGVTTLVIGFSMAFKSANMVYLALALIGGGLIGTWLNIDGAILRFGVFLERLTKSGRTGAASSGGDDSRGFRHGFLNASVLFCVARWRGRLLKAARGYSPCPHQIRLDGFMAIFSPPPSAGVAFSALSHLFYQGAHTLAAGTLKPSFLHHARRTYGVGCALVS